MTIPVNYYTAVSQSAPTQWWRLNDAPGSRTAANEVSASITGILGQYFQFVTSTVGSSTLSGPTSGSLYNWYTLQSGTVFHTASAIVNANSSSILFSGAMAHADFDCYKPFSIEFWFRPDDTNQGSHMMWSKCGVNNLGLLVTEYGGALRAFMNYLPGITGTQNSVAAQWNPATWDFSNIWHHFCFVYAGSTSMSAQVPSLNLYVDGFPANKTSDFSSIAASSTMANSGALMIGGPLGYTLQQYSAWSDFAYYNRVLSATEIYDHFISFQSGYPISNSLAMDSGTLPATPSTKEIKVSNKPGSYFMDRPNLVNVTETSSSALQFNFDSFILTSGTTITHDGASSASVTSVVSSSDHAFRTNYTVAGGGGSNTISYVYQSILVPAAAADGRAPKLEKLSRFQTKDDTVNRLQDQNVRVLNPLLSNPLVQGHILSNLPLKAGLNNIDHGLDRAPSGWTIVNITAPATIIQTTGSQNLASKFMILSSSAVCTASIYVF